MVRKLVIESRDNEDVIGTYLKDEVEQEMRELSNPPKNNTDWLYWVTGHVFDMREFTGDIEKVICEIDTITDLTLNLDGDIITVHKVYHN